MKATPKFKQVLKQVLPPVITLITLTSVSSTAVAENFWEEDVWLSEDRGFLYYPSENENSKLPPIDLKMLPSIEAIKAERARRLDIAIMEPTQENVRLYLEVNNFVQEKSALFADQWRRTLWQHPEFDFTTRNPAANFAQVQMKADKTQQNYATLETLNKEWGLIYFYRSDCKFCKLQSPLVRKLADDFGFEIIAISMDGISNEFFPGSLPDNGIGALLTEGHGVNQVPALFMVNRKQTQSYMISSGVVALEDLLNRIVLLGTKEAGDSLFGGSELKETTQEVDPTKLFEASLSPSSINTSSNP